MFILSTEGPVTMQYTCCRVQSYTPTQANSLAQANSLSFKHHAHCNEQDNEKSFDAHCRKQ